MNRAVYAWGREFGVVWIIDRDEIGAASVTNDVERVIRDLQALAVDVDAQPLVYRDSTGRWDQIETRAGRFAGFRSLGGAKALDEALAALAAMNPNGYRCPYCSAISHNPSDLRYRYCARCHRFAEDLL
jgi:hypothetical protein